MYCLGLNFIGRSKAMSFLKEAGWDAKVDAAKSPSLAMQFIVPIGLFGGLLVGGIVGLCFGAPWTGRNSVIDYAVPGGIVGLIVSGIIYYQQYKK